MRTFSGGFESCLQRFFMKTQADFITFRNLSQRRLLQEFLERTGYGPADILSLSFETHTFLTRNGGKYELNNHHIKHLACPDPSPNSRL